MGKRSVAANLSIFLVFGSGVTRLTAVAIMEGEPLPEKTYNHVAFQIAEEDFELYAERVRRQGVDVKEGRRRLQGEGRSLYFYDYDNHLFELHTGTLISVYKGIGVPIATQPAHTLKTDFSEYRKIATLSFFLTSFNRIESEKGS